MTKGSNDDLNLAIFQNQIMAANNVYKLYAGMQPTAAAALGQLAGFPVQSGVGVTGQATPNISSRYAKGISAKVDVQYYGYWVRKGF